ncbi:MAG: hypothetical protein SynsKO_21740 [Synoicihabitans sp.]
MSQSATISITCPECGEEQDFTAWNSINVSLAPDKKTALRNGSLTRFTCAKCGESSEVNYPILYHDPEKKFMVWLYGDADDEKMRGLMVGDFLEDYQLRLADSRNQLVEKTHVLEAGLDDRILELFKLVTRMSQNSIPEGELLFAGVGVGQNDAKELQFAVVSEAETKFIGAPLEAFEKYAEIFYPIVDLEPLEAMKWAKINQAYAQDIIDRRLPDLMGGE